MTEQIEKTQSLVRAASVTLSWLETVEKRSQCRDTQTGAMGMIPMLRGALAPFTSPTTDAIQAVLDAVQKDAK